MTRGFVLGATAGRTTLTGEGLQHADGHSQLLAATNPPSWPTTRRTGTRSRTSSRTACGGCTARTPGERHLLPHGLQRALPAAREPEDLDVDGLLRGHLPLPVARGGRRSAGAAPGLRRGRAVGAGGPAAAGRGLGRAADVWSVTSWSELRRDAVDDRPGQPAAPRRRAAGPVRHRRRSRRSAGPVIATTDWMRAVPNLIRPGFPAPMYTLGADGFGFSDTRPAARRHFLIDAPVHRGRRRSRHWPAPATSSSPRWSRRLAATGSTT